MTKPLAYRIIGRWLSVYFVKGDFDMNLVILRGNLARDPMLRSTAKGTSVVSFTVATSRSYKKQDGTWQEDTTFTKCEAWDSAANNIAQNFKKGDAIFVEGTLKEDNYEKDGVTHYGMKVRVGSFGKLERTRRADKAPATEAEQEETEEVVAAGDNIPF